MNYRRLGKTGWMVSEVSLGTWQLGGRWGEPFDSKRAKDTLDAAVESGVNFIDTADIYRDGLSEEAVGELLRRHKGRLYVATKCGRALVPHTEEAYTPEAMRHFVESSLKNLNLETLDLIQLHCPPTGVYYRPEVFGVFEDMAAEGKIRHLGVSVERVEEGLKALEFDNVATIQVIYNLFRRRPEELLFPQAKMRDVGILTRVPLASGLLSGKIGRSAVFGPEDHRSFNRHGERFDRGETFAGIDFDTGLDALEEIKAVVGSEESLAPWALRWILMRDEVSCVIPGASEPQQVRSNVLASDLEPLDAGKMEKLDRIYRERIRSMVHNFW